MNSLALTHEQKQIIAYKGRKLVVRAFAGTGKTFTLVQFAIANPHLRILYVAYNRAIREEADSKFPRNVVCKTTHQICYATVGKRYRHKLRQNIRLRDVADACDTSSWSVASDILATLLAFLVSKERKMGDEHFTSGTKKDDAQKASYQQLAYVQSIVESASNLWLRMIDLDDEFPATHDTYVKLYQLSKPDLSAQYDLILLDEAQDTVPVCADLLTQQECRLIVVGDSSQQIYSYRGAKSVLDAADFRDAHTLYLTQSFRFGRSIASIANILLNMLGVEKPVIGLGTADRAIPASDFSLRNHKGPITFLSRTVMGVIQTAMFFARLGFAVNMVGGSEAYNLEPIENLYWLANNEKHRVRDKRLLAEFDSYDDYCDMAEASKEPEMLRAVKIISSFPSLPNDIALLRKQSSGPPGMAPITVTTAHRSKGLEFDTVYLCDDFPDIFADEKIDDETREQEINLLYVAATRAKHLLIFNEMILSAVRMAVTQNRPRYAVES